MARRETINNKTHLFFDLDHTLWDFDKNSKLTLLELYDEFGIGVNGVSSDDFVATFYKINGQLWEQFNNGNKEKNFIRKHRFAMIFKELQISESIDYHKVQERYIERCPLKPHTLTNAINVLEQLKAYYNMSIITNGFEEIQHKKLTGSGLLPYFEHIITSTQAGTRKPDPAIFHHAMNLAGCTSKECIMIGDDPITDILGAQKVGIDQVYLNTKAKPCNPTPTFEIKNLNELLPLLV